VLEFKNYLNQHAIYTELVHDMRPNADLELVVVIPACSEKDYLKKCLASLVKTNPIQASVEILIIVNDGMHPNEEIRTENQESIRLIKDFLNTDNPNLKILPVYVDLSNYKKPGVGLARKIGMDEAIRRYLSLIKDGLIVCLDADCIVGKNYFHEIYKAFIERPKLSAASIHFEHQLDANKDSIIQYELHLRYFIAMQRRIGLPFAFQTVGSCIAVRASAYCKQAGMNKRQAGEDFYFLQKFIANNQCFEINKTTVFPSDRGSERVPFGTGKAVNKIKATTQELHTYHPENFFLIEDFTKTVFKAYTDLKFTREQFLGLNAQLFIFLEKIDFIQMLNQIKANTNQLKSFQKRFYKWFNAFMLMKCLHSLRETVQSDIPVSDAIRFYFSTVLNMQTPVSTEEQLYVLRKQAKSENKYV